MGSMRIARTHGIKRLFCRNVLRERSGWPWAGFLALWSLYANQEPVKATRTASMQRVRHCRLYEGNDSQTRLLIHARSPQYIASTDAVVGKSARRCLVWPCTLGIYVKARRARESQRLTLRGLQPKKHRGLAI